VSRNPVILKQNPFAGYQKSAQHHRLRVKVRVIEQLGLDYQQMRLEMFDFEANTSAVDVTVCCFSHTCGVRHTRKLRSQKRARVAGLSMACARITLLLYRSTKQAHDFNKLTTWTTC
jgi:hypothetical protein